MIDANAKWWNTIALESLNPEQWEALCDSCAKCCLHKLEDEDTGEVFYTQIRCQHLNEQDCRCSDYPNRSVMVPHCIKLERSNVADLHWLPTTCAYRLRSEGKPLPEWHYLESGSHDSVHLAGVSIRGRAISDEYVHPDGYDEHIITWIE